MSAAAAYLRGAGVAYANGANMSHLAPIYMVGALAAERAQLSEDDAEAQGQAEQRRQALARRRSAIYAAAVTPVLKALLEWLRAVDLEKIAKAALATHHKFLDDDLGLGAVQVRQMIRSQILAALNAELTLSATALNAITAALAAAWAMAYAEGAAEAQAAPPGEVPDPDDVRRCYDPTGVANSQPTTAHMTAAMWLDQLLGSLAGAGAFATVAPGATHATVTSALTSRSAVSWAVTDAMHAAAIAALLDVVSASSPTAMVNYNVVGDRRTCSTCFANAMNGPYPVGASPLPPVHPNCRCWLEPAPAR